MDHKPSTIPFQMFGSTLRCRKVDTGGSLLKDAIVIKKPTNSMKFHPGHWQTGMRSQNGGCFFGVNFLYGQKAYPLTMAYETLLNWHFYLTVTGIRPQSILLFYANQQTIPSSYSTSNNSRSYTSRYIYIHIHIYYIYMCFLYDYAAELPNDSSCWGGERYLQGSFS